MACCVEQAKVQLHLATCFWCFGASYCCWCYLGSSMYATWSNMAAQCACEGAVLKHKGLRLLSAHGRLPSYQSLRTQRSRPWTSVLVTDSATYYPPFGCNVVFIANGIMCCVGTCNLGPVPSAVSTCSGPLPIMNGSSNGCTWPSFLAADPVTSQ